MKLALAKKTGIYGDLFRRSGLDEPEIRMGGVEEIVMLLGDDDIGHSEDCGCPLVCPAVTDALSGRGRGTLAPIRRKIVERDRKYERVIEGSRD